MQTLVRAALALSTLAACGSSARSTTPATGGGDAITIELGAPDPEFGLPGFDDHGALPAISADGTLVAALLHDEVDFVGLPVDTVAVWRTTDGTLVGSVASNDREPPDEGAAPDTSRAAAATALLAGQRWTKAAPMPAPVPSPEGDKIGVPFDDGIALVFADESLFVVEADDWNVPRGAIVPSGFPAPGDGSDEIGGGDCGTVGGFKPLATGPGWFLIAPDKLDLGGDSCHGRPLVDLVVLTRRTK